MFLNAIRLKKKCDKGFNKSFLAFFYIPDQYKTQEVCSSIIPDDPFSLRHVLDQYKTQKMCDKAVDDCLAALKFVPDWFVASKMIKILFTALYVDENALYFNEDSSNAVCICNEMGILNIDLNNIKLTILIMIKMILIPLFLSDFWLGILNLKNAKNLRKR